MKLWYNFSVFEVTEIMRQLGDHSCAVCLNNLAIGEMTPSNQELSKKCLSNSTPSEVRSVNTNTMVLPHLDIERITTSIVASSKNSALQLNRKQFPVVPAEAMTVHKSQGGTYDSVVVYDTSRKKMSIYVAASRATKAAGLKLICKENKFIPPPPLSADKGSDLYLEICCHEGVRLIPQFAHLSTRTNIESIYN